MDRKTTEEIKRVCSVNKSGIKKRLNEFKCIWSKASEEDIFAELVFCILTPQSKAKSCWAAVKRLRDKDLLLKATAQRIAKELQGVRFQNNKSRYIVEARRLFTTGGRIKLRDKPIGTNQQQARQWLAKNVKGLGLKEASHFLRNIGLGQNLAILDRHVLKNLYLLGAIKEIPKTLSRRKYLEMENKMKKLAEKAAIPIGHLDLVLWCKETGGVFK